ncbi:MAG: hypothetical protein AAF267_19315 [Deinococcota bacterium]
MAVYNAVTDVSLSNSPYNLNPQASWLLDRAARLERRLELGTHLSDEASAWLFRDCFPDRHLFWLECLVKADLDGVVQYVNLESWRRFDTGRKRRYLLAGLEQLGLIERLSRGWLRVTA